MKKYIYLIMALLPFSTCYSQSDSNMYIADILFRPVNEKYAMENYELVFTMDSTKKLLFERDYIKFRNQGKWLKSKALLVPINVMDTIAQVLLSNSQGYHRFYPFFLYEFFIISRYKNKPEDSERETTHYFKPDQTDDAVALVNKIISALPKDESTHELIAELNSFIDMLKKIEVKPPFKN